MPGPSNVGFNVQRLPEDQVGAAKGAMVQAELMAGEASRTGSAIQLNIRRGTMHLR